MDQNGNLNPFNKLDMVLIELYEDGKCVRLEKPNKDKICIVNGSEWMPHGFATPYEVTAYSVLGVCVIETLTDKFYNEALKFLTYKFGGTPEDNGHKSVEWSFPSKEEMEDIEAQVEAHHEMLAEIARGK